MLINFNQIVFKKCLAGDWKLVVIWSALVTLRTNWRHMSSNVIVGRSPDGVSVLRIFLYLSKVTVIEAALGMFIKFQYFCLVTFGYWKFLEIIHFSVGKVRAIGIIVYSLTLRTSSWIFTQYDLLLFLRRTFESVLSIEIRTYIL